MLFRLAILAFLCLNAAGILFAQQGADSAHRYFRLICLVPFTGSGRDGQGIMPEFVADGVAAAKAGDAASASRSASIKAAETAAANSPDARPAPTKAFLVSRPGIIAWGTQPTDDGKMTILQLVAVDRHAFDAILNDKRSEIRLFEIGKDSKENIEAEMRKFKRDFSLEGFRVFAQ